MREAETKQIVDDVLAHFGTKGMRWGIQNVTEKSTMTKTERKAVKKNMRDFGKTVINKKFESGLDRRITQKQYDKLSTKTNVIPKGQILNRVTRRKDEKFQGMTYVSYKPGDKDIYRAIMPLQASPFKMGGNRTYRQNYEYTFKALETLRSPSEKERIDSFVKLFDSDVTLRNGKKITGREFLKRTGYAHEVRTLNSQQLGLRMYNTFASEQFMKTPMNTAYFKALSAKGYNSILDDNDRGHLAQSPLIILNPNGTLKKMSVKTLSADDINKAQLKIKVP